MSDEKNKFVKRMKLIKKMKTKIKIIVKTELIK
jgi:hypothetical protein